MLTQKQRQILTYIEQQIAKKEVAPTHREIARRFKLSSVATVHEHLAALQKKGFLKRQRGQARAIVTSNQSSELVPIPLLGIISAGQPIEALENKETILVSKTQLPLFEKAYALRVSGDSMIDEGIEDGDIVVVRRQDTANNGDRVVALLNNTDVTLKRFYKNSREIRLQPANKKYDPIIVGPDTPISIQGIVVQTIKAQKQEPIADRQETRKALAPKLNRIICGDTVSIMEDLPESFFDAVIIDPPYNIGKDFGNNIDRRELAEYIAWAERWMNQSLNLLKPSGTMFVYGFSEILAHLSIKIPLHRQRWLIWHYTNKNVASLNFWQRSHESILCVWKEDRQFNRDAVREPYTEGFLNGAAGRIRKDTIGRYSKGGKQTVYAAHEGGALPRDVIKIPALAGGAGMTERWFLCNTCNEVYAPRELDNHRTHKTVKHPTQKPFDLTRRLLKSCLPEKDGKVFIPFAGTGSECVIARELGADYLGVEINPEYVTLANGILSRIKS
ncbi:MAG: transcriptional repressor LexA [bacterium]|nr:transcriptional repressor LexA [bacterium]